VTRPDEDDEFFLDDLDEYDEDAEDELWQMLERER
jgi:hypothetical protein